jgi:hypothetical protein
MHLLGEKYEGEWEDGLKHGRGKWFFANGYVFSSLAYSIQLSNKNIFFSFKRDFYEGNFYYDKFHGRGVFYSHATKTSKQGSWVNGTLIQQDFQ